MARWKAFPGIPTSSTSASASDLRLGTDRVLRFTKLFAISGSKPSLGRNVRPKLRSVGTFLVSGGAGFIGSHLVDDLVELGHDVRVLDNLDSAAHDGLPDHLNPRVDYLFEDVRSAEAWMAALAGVDAVSHQAARVGLGVDMGDVSDYVSVNDGGTAAMLVAMHRVGFRGRLVLASSMTVYGEGAYGCQRHGAVRPGPRDPADLMAGRFDPRCPDCAGRVSPEAVSEDSPPDPRNVYAATKLHQEHLCLAYARETGVPFVALRYHNVYGPRMPRDTPYAGVASIFRSALEAGEAPQVFEDGWQLRDFIHVRDVARANVLGLTAAPAESGVFNIASGEPKTVGDMAGALSRAFGPDAPKPVVTGRFRLGDVRHVFGSPDRAAEVLGFRARVPFDQGMAEFARAPLRAAAAAGRPGGPP
jgi:dTDP-L-rhamnose 4-epimerase